MPSSNKDWEEFDSRIAYAKNKLEEVENFSDINNQIKYIDYHFNDEGDLIISVTSNPVTYKEGEMLDLKINSYVKKIDDFVHGDLTTTKLDKNKFTYVMNNVFRRKYAQGGIISSLTKKTSLKQIFNS